jgi:hypothetical protein
MSGAVVSIKPRCGVDGNGDDVECPAVVVRDLGEHGVRSGRDLEDGGDGPSLPGVDPDAQFDHVEVPSRIARP